MSKSVNVDFVTRQIEVDTDGKEYYVSAAVAAKDAETAAVSAQNAANEAEKIATDLGLVDEAVQTAVASAEQASNSATTASNKADIATAKADVATAKASEASASANTATAKADSASTSAANAAQSYANADAIATQLTEYLATKETLTAPAVDKTLLIEGAAADSKVVGELKDDLVQLNTFNILDLVTYENGCYYSDITGEKLPNGNYSCSMILVKPNKWLHIDCDTQVLFSFYDKNKSFIIGYSGYYDVFVPQNAFYVGFSIQTSSINNATLYYSNYFNSYKFIGTKGNPTYNLLNNVSFTLNETYDFKRNKSVFGGFNLSDLIDISDYDVLEYNACMFILDTISICPLLLYANDGTTMVLNIKEDMVQSITGDRTAGVLTANGRITIPYNAKYARILSAGGIEPKLKGLKLSDVNVETKRRIIMIGDSYGIQNTDGDITKFYWEYVRDALGLTEGDDFYHHYQSGAGFGDNEYLTQLQGMGSSITKKDTITDIFICGGWNDSDKSQDYGTDEAYANGTLAFYNYVKSNYPNAKITIGYISWGSFTETWFYNQMRVGIDRYMFTCNQYGWRFLANTCYILQDRDSDIWQSDNAHPNNKGQKILGENLTSPFLDGAYDISRIVDKLLRP